MNLWTLISTIILSLSLSNSSFYNLPALILEESEGANRVVLNNHTLDDNNLIPHKIDNKSLGVKIGAQAAAVMDKNTGIILWQKNASQTRSLASITKLMTALVFLDNNPGWNTEITMEQSDEINGGTNRILRGETVKITDLFYTSLIASDNNSTRALVRSTGLETGQFVNLMNQKAVGLGLNNTKFVEPTGLEEANKSTALEILSLAKIAFANQDIRDVVGLKVYNFRAASGQDHKIQSTNLLLNSFLDVEAGKTGYIGASGYCLVSEIASDSGQNIIGVVLGSESHEARFQDLKILSSWVLENFIWS